ncbi:MAG: M20 family metallopeptidase [bacterium]|jgi:aminobenzoyl-glutamate utilization protein B
MLRKSWVRMLSVMVVVMLLFSMSVQAAPDVEQLRREAISSVEKQAQKLYDMGDWMYHNPEPGYFETEAVKLLTGYLKSNGFKLDIGIAGLETAFKAEYKFGNDGPTVAYIVEYDALRGPGGTAFHGCQHNLQGPAGLGAAVALKQMMEKNKIAGRLWVIGTPAEEIPPPAKGKMLAEGVFDGADVLLMFHGSGTTNRLAAGWSGVTLDSTRYTFTGKSAHASGDPWNGRDALDAARLMFAGADAYREHILPDARIHGVITKGGEAPNVIPPIAETDFFYRHPTREYVDQMGERLATIAKAAAMMTDTEVEITNYGKYYNTLGIAALEERAFTYAKSYGATEIVEEPQTGGSTDFAELSGKFPAICISVASKPKTAAGHSIEAADASIADIGHQGMLIASKVLAALGVDILTDPEYLSGIKYEFTEAGDPPTVETYTKVVRW